MSQFCTIDKQHLFFKKITCALCVCLSAVSWGVAFGFGSQLTYSLEHGYKNILVTDVDISLIGQRLIYYDMYTLSTKTFLGGALPMGCTIGYFVGGWISLIIGKRIMLIVCNIGSVITWITLALISDEVVMIIIERFAMGIFVAAAFGCIGELLVQAFSHIIKILFN